MPNASHAGVLSPFNHWLTICRQANRSRAKLAALGGSGDDVPFEQAFSSLAHAYMADKAPSLLDHEQGFQLLDRNEDNTKAVAVFGFKVGSNQLYAPVFFLQGDLKGHELLYLKNQDLMVPLKENWLNYVLNRKPHIIGEGTGRNTSQIGVMQPDISRLRSPAKFAAALPEWCLPFMPKYASLMEDGAFSRTVAELEGHCRERLDLGHFLKQANLDMLEALVEHCQQFPRVGQLIDEYHGLDTVRDAVKMASLREKTSSVLARRASPRPAPTYYTGSLLAPREKRAAGTDSDAKQKVKILTYDASEVQGLPEGLIEEDQEKLLKEKVLIRDERSDEDVSVPYNVQVEKRLFNPSESGLYMILTKPGDFEKCLVVLNPHGPNGRNSFATLVRVDSPRNWVNYRPTQLWATSRIEGKEYDSWYDGLPEATSLDTGDTRYILVGPRGNGTLPFKVEKSYGKANGETVYEVEFSHYCSGPRASQHTGFKLYEYVNLDREYDHWRDGQRVHLNGKDGTDLRSNRGDLWVPKGYKLLRASPSEADTETKKKTEEDAEANDLKKDQARSEAMSDSGENISSEQKKDEAGCEAMSDSGRSKDLPIWPGDLVDAELALFTKTAGLKLHHDGHEVCLNDQPPCQPLSALVYLVRDHGFREDVARHMLKVASSQRTLRVRVKYASPYLTQGGPTAPSIPDTMQSGDNPMGAPAQTQSFQEASIPVPGMSAGMSDTSGYNVRPEATQPGGMSGGGGLGQDRQSIQQASQTGQKEVFDTAVIGSMLKAVRDDTMIDQYLPDLIKGMDRKGRILFQFYAHGDKFAERYGKTDMPELEDSLRDAFDRDGDVILFLKQKTIEPHPEQADAVALNLDKGRG